MLSSVEGIMNVFDREESLGRPIAWSEGDFWRKKRAWTVKTLKEQGFDKSSSMESSTKDEIKILLEKWNSELV
jgi:hypothetical protein